MALKSFHKETLNDNWFEERSEPLNGVLPNDRVILFTTSTRTEFTQNNAQVVQGKPRMIHDGNLSQALIQSREASTARSFLSALPRPDLDAERRYLETTHRVAFGSPSPISRERQPAMAGGGTGDGHVNRGKSASGAAGEVYKTSAEPQQDTASQRAWLYSTDPMIVAMKSRTRGAQLKEQQPESKNMSSIDDHKRKTTSITGIPYNHKGVFADD